jgi:hypothetical protein
MRYQVGSIVPFIRIQFAYPNCNVALMSNTFLPWESKLKGISIFWLECAEHHKVFNSWDEKKTGDTYDGFIFKSQIADDARIWHNQYPTASYGQLSDSNNYVAKRDVSEEELEEKGVEGCSPDYYLTDLCYYLANLLNGEYELRHKHDQADYADQLKELYDRVVDMIENIDGKPSGKKVVVDSKTIGDHVFEGIYDVTIETFEV